MYMKKVIGVAAVIMVIMAIVLIAFSSTVSAYAIERTFTKEGGVLYYEGTLPRDANHESTGISVYEGEAIHFENASTGCQVDVIVSGPYDDDGDTRSGCRNYLVEAGKPWDSSGMKTLYFFKVVEMNDPDVGCWFGLEKHSFSLELEKEKVREGENFTLHMKKNNKERGVMKLTVEDNEGFSIMNVNGIDIYELLVAYGEYKDFIGFADTQNPVEGISFEDGKLIFDTTKLGMKEGKYEIILEDYATEVEKKVDIKVEKRYLKVECDDKVMKGDDIIMVIRSSFCEEKVNVTVGDFYRKLLTLDKEGKKKVKISTEDMDYGMYKITIEVCGLKETKYVTIKKGKARLEEVPASATVGDIVHIEGASDFGDFAVFLVDSIFKGEIRISEKWREKVFEWNWDTRGELEGGREIEVFILREHVPLSIGDNISKNWQKKEGVDAAASIFLFPPMLRMTVHKHIAAGDDVVISGKTTGTDRVYIIAINKEGDVVSPPDGIARATPVEESKWEENIGELDSRNYTVISLHKGKDGRTNAIENGKWAAGGENKTLEERVAILMDAIRSTGSDDLFALFNFTVEPSYVSFNPIENVTIGEPLEITGKTNREPGTKIGIWTIEGPTMLPPVITEVEWLAADQGMFTATIDTYDAVPGIYTLKAEDGDLNMDTATVEIRVSPPRTPEVSISTDKKEYSPSDAIKTTIRLSNPTDSAQNMLFEWHFIRDYNNGTEIEQTTINLSANYDQTSTTSIPVEDWGNKSFCGCYIVSLTNMTTNNVVSVDSASWIYLPSAECKSKTAAEITKEIKKGVEGVELPI